MNYLKYIFPTFLFFFMWGCYQKEDCSSMKIGNIKISRFDIDSTYHIYVSLLVTNNTSENLIIKTPNDSTKYAEPSSYFVGIVGSDTIPFDEYIINHLRSEYIVTTSEPVYFPLYIRDYDRFRSMTIDQLEDKLTNLKIVYNDPDHKLCLVADNVEQKKKVRILPNGIGIEEGFLLGYYEFMEDYSDSVFYDLYKCDDYE